VQLFHTVRGVPITARSRKEKLLQGMYGEGGDWGGGRVKERENSLRTPQRSGKKASPDRWNGALFNTLFG